MSPLQRFVQSTQNPVEHALQYLLVWLAHVDDEYAAEEQAVVRRAFGTSGDSQSEELASIARLSDPDDVAFASKVIQKGLTDEGKALAIELAVLVSVADGRLSVGENHALRFIADVLGIGASTLAQRYTEITGKEFRAPPDLSNAATWTRQSGRREHQSRSDHRKGSRRKEHQKSGTSSGGGNQREKSRGRGTEQVMDRERAREILGVARDATDEEIRSAYRRLAQRTHPDRFRTLGDDAVATAQSWFQQVQKAYEALRR